MVLSSESSRRRRKTPIFAALLLILFITVPAASSHRAPRDKRHPMEASKGVHEPKKEGGHENQSGGESPFLCKPNTYCHAALCRAAEFVVNSTTITVPSYSFLPFWLSTISVCPGELVEPNRVWGDKCSEADLMLVQGPTAPMDTGIPTYTVEIVNVCATGCNISGIHLSCAWFSSARLINPKIFKRLRYDDCLVNDGKPLRYGHSVSFQYANTFSYPLSVTAVKC